MSIFNLTEPLGTPHWNYEFWLEFWVVHLCGQLADMGASEQTAPWPQIALWG